MLRKDLLGENHQDTLDSLEMVILNLIYLDRYDEALEKAEECYRSYNKTLGDTDKSTINSLCRIGDILVKLGRHNEAHDIYKACYRKRKETLGEDHPDTQSLLSYLSE